MIHSLTLREKCLYSEFFWSVFSRIQTKYGEISIFLYSVRMRENTDQNNSKYGQFSRSVTYTRTATYFNLFVVYILSLSTRPLAWLSVIIR